MREFVYHFILEEVLFFSMFIVEPFYQTWNKLVASTVAK